MAVTATAQQTLQKEMDLAKPDTMPDVARLMDLGTMLTPLKRTFTGLTALAAQDLTLIDGTGEVVGPANPKRLALLTPTTVRVTAGAAAAGARFVTDVGGTPSATVATISDDGKTITFEGTVTAFVIEYIPRAKVDMLAKFPTG